MKEIKCNNILEVIENETIEDPVRSWINKNLNELEAKIKSARVVDYEWYFVCTPGIIIAFFKITCEVLDGVESALIFGADELGLDPSIKKICYISRCPRIYY